MQTRKPLLAVWPTTLAKKNSAKKRLHSIQHIPPPRYTQLGTVSLPSAFPCNTPTSPPLFHCICSRKKENICHPVTVSHLDCRTLSRCGQDEPPCQISRSKTTSFKRYCPDTHTGPIALRELTRHRSSTSTRWHFAFALCCHSNPVHRLQIRPTVHNWGYPLPFPKLHPGPCSSVSMRRRTDTHTQTDTQTRDQYTQ